MSDTTETTTTTAGAGTNPGADSGSGTPAASSPADEKRFTQAELNAFLADERRKADEKRKADEARAKQQADEQAAKDRGEWEKVAQGAQAERDRVSAEHATLSERHTALQAAVEKLVKAQLAELPEHIRELAPKGDDLAERLEWIARARKAAAPTTPGTPSGPRGTGAAAPLSANADILAQKRARIGGL